MTLSQQKTVEQYHLEPVGSRGGEQPALSVLAGDDKDDSHLS